MPVSILPKPERSYLLCLMNSKYSSRERIESLKYSRAPIWLTLNYHRFQCLRQDSEGWNYLPDTSLKSLQSETLTHPHNLFSQAVGAHITGLDGFHQDVTTPSSYGPYDTFRLPVCISGTIKLHIYPDDKNNNQEFPFHCGDWKASETKNCQCISLFFYEVVYRSGLFFEVSTKKKRVALLDAQVLMLVY